MTFDEFKTMYDFCIKNNLHVQKKWREGQMLLLLLNQFWSEEFKHITSFNYYDRMDIDCYTNDALIPNTLEHLRSIWYKYPYG